MTRKEAVDFVLKQLVLRTPRDRIIAVLSQQTNMPWTEAEKFIKQVETENPITVSRQNIFLTLISSIFSIAMGAFLLILGMIYLLNFFHISVFPNFYFSPPNPIVVRSIRTTIVAQLVQWFIDSLFGRILIVLVGAGFLISGLIGLLQTVKSWSGKK